jgi:hypothetical protein
MATQNANAVAITGGTINGATVGATTAAAGTFTTLSTGALTATGQTSLGGVAGSEGLRVNAVAGSNTWLDVTGSNASRVDVTALGPTGTNVALRLSSRGTQPVNFYTTAQTALQFSVAHTTSAVNYVQVTGAATGGAVAISAQGSDGNIGLNLTTKGTGGFNFASNGTSNSVFTGNSGTHFRVRTDIASASNFWEVFGSSASAILRSTSATQSGLIQSGGTGGIFIQTNAGTTQAAVTHTASAVNYVQVTGGATGANPSITVQGSDASRGLNFTTKGTGFFNFYSQNGTNFQFRVDSSAVAVNHLVVAGSVASSSPVLSAQGSDTDIDLTLTPKGTGNVRFGTYTAGILAQTGYITVKDSGGTTRRLLVG